MSDEIKIEHKELKVDLDVDYFVVIFLAFALAVGAYFIGEGINFAAQHWKDVELKRLELEYKVTIEPADLMSNKEAALEAEKRAKEDE